MVRPLGNCIVLSPPLTCTGEDIETILAALEAGISTA